MKNSKIKIVSINLNSHILRSWMTFLRINLKKDKKNDLSL